VSVRSPDAVTGVAFITMFPLTFLANAFVPAAGLPDGLQTVAEWNPVSAVIAAVRTLFGNPTATPAHAAWPPAHGDRRGRVVARDPRRRRAADRVALPRAHDRLSRGSAQPNTGASDCSTHVPPGTAGSPVQSVPAARSDRT
jgi:hypothetical protein